MVGQRFSIRIADEQMLQKLRDAAEVSSGDTSEVIFAALAKHLGISATKRHVGRPKQKKIENDESLRASA